jgi:hypothetical protein
MLRSVILALVSLGLVLLATFALTPADAATSDLETYIWSFASLDSNQLVCKQVVMHPERQLQRRSSKEKVVQMHSMSTIVDDRYCANSAKPYVEDS